jgi:PAS domain S-box-containing protein
MDVDSVRKNEKTTATLAIAEPPGPSRPTWTFVSLVVAAVAIAVGGTWLYRDQGRRLREAAERELEAIVTLKAREITAWRKERLGDAAILSDSPALHRAARRSIAESAPDPDFEAHVLALAHRYGYADVLLVDASGNLRWSLRRQHSEKLHAAGREALRIAFQEHKAVLSDLHAAPEDGTPHLVAVAPIWDTDGAPLGATVLVSDATTALFPMISGWPTPSATAETLLVRRDGPDVLFLNELRHRPHTALRLRLSADDPDLPGAIALRGLSRTVVGRDYRGEPVLSAMTSVPGSNWYVVAKVDLAEALATWRFRSSSIISMGVVLTLLALALTAVVWQRSDRSHYRQLAEAERAARVSEARLGVALEAAHQGTYDLDLETGSARVSDEYARMLGYEPATFEETNALWIERLHPEDREMAVAAFRSYVAGTTPAYRVEFRQRTRSGSWIWLISLGRVVERDEQGRPLRMLGTHTDITERKTAEEELRRVSSELERRVEERTAQLDRTVAELRDREALLASRADALLEANKELEAFSYSVSHDLRTPLRAIEGFARILLEDHTAALNPEGQRLLGVVRSNIRKMASLIDDLLELARLGRQALKLTPVDMGALARAVADELLTEEASKGVELVIGALPPAHADAVLVRQAFANLIDNALKYSAPKRPSHIQVRGNAEGDEVVYSVEDDGVGFDMAYADKLFGVFQRLHSARDFEGTGVGLALVKRIVTRHGGRVGAEGRVGEGARFWFTLPSMGERE